jgi:hypothetical protein
MGWFRAYYDGLMPPQTVRTQTSSTQAFISARERGSMPSMPFPRKTQVLLALLVIVPITFVLLNRVLPEPLLTTQDLVRPTVPFVMQIPTKRGDTAAIRTQGEFVVAVLEIAQPTETLRGPWMDIPAPLRRDLTALQTSWCTTLPRWTVNRQQPFYEVSMLCPGSSWKTYTVAIPPDHLPPALMALVSLVTATP